MCVCDARRRVFQLGARKDFGLRRNRAPSSVKNDRNKEVARLKFRTCIDITYAKQTLKGASVAERQE